MTARPGAPLFGASEQMSQVSSCWSGKSGVIDGTDDMSVDDSQCLAERGSGRWMIYGQKWSEKTPVDLGVEDGDADAVGGRHIHVRAWLAADQALAAEATQAIRHLRRGIGAGEESGYLGTQAPIGEAGYGVDGDAECAGQGHRRPFNTGRDWIGPVTGRSRGSGVCNPSFRYTAPGCTSGRIPIEPMPGAARPG